ncbi:ABC transporter ATP-binding protein [Lactobacillus sp. DCY120]|uniref:ABC transporter ATP-binding protein n=1 Tax=Bombilactobacillus apium TaxID=2675299 RepID=A0A850RA12_9LACO|nr:ABC transporter ATP-binding protein [Bombilactobacillus apium]NVY96216.1 ABC transporter ATP-binding protein [Bombilactobacillus apium]
MTTTLLQIDNLDYKKKNHTILQNVNLEIDLGHFVGLAGLNGAGKTTLMRLIAGTAYSSTGTISLAGDKNVAQRKSHLSFSDELRGFNKYTRVHDIQSFYETVYPDFSNERYHELAQFLELQDDDRLGSLSKGMRERLTIALTLARKVPLYLLDEPFSGIDVLSRKKIIKGLLSWVDDESTVVISSHHLEEIKDILDQIVIIKDQTIFTHQDTETLIAKEQCSLEDYFEKIYTREVQDDKL